MVADPLRLMDICATSDGGAALIVSSLEYARKIGKSDAPRVAAISTVTPTFASSVVEMPDIATDSAAAAGIEAHAYRSALPLKAYEEAGIGPEDVDLAEVYDLSTALELDWIEDLRLAPRGEATALLRAGDTALGGKIPVNVSGGLACFGEAVPAQALAQKDFQDGVEGHAVGRPSKTMPLVLIQDIGHFNSCLLHLLDHDV